MPATTQTAPQMVSASQHGPQHNVILLYTGFALMLLDLKYDKPTLSLIILMLFVMSLSYPIDASVSRG
jgi:hypothetical protein